MTGAFPGFFRKTGGILASCRGELRGAREGFHGGLLFIPFFFGERSRSTDPGLTSNPFAGGLKQEKP